MLEVADDAREVALDGVPDGLGDRVRRRAEAFGRDAGREEDEGLVRGAIGGGRRWRRRRGRGGWGRGEEDGGGDGERATARGRVCSERGKKAGLWGWDRSSSTAAGICTLTTAGEQGRRFTSGTYLTAGEPLRPFASGRWPVRVCPNPRLPLGHCALCSPVVLALPLANRKSCSPVIFTAGECYFQVRQ